MFFSKDSDQSDPDHPDQRLERLDADQASGDPAAAEKAEGLHQQHRPQELLLQQAVTGIRIFRTFDDVEKRDEHHDHLPAALSAGDTRAGPSRLGREPQQVEKVSIVKLTKRPILIHQV